MCCHGVLVASDLQVNLQVNLQVFYIKLVFLKVFFVVIT